MHTPWRRLSLVLVLLLGTPLARLAAQITETPWTVAPGSLRVEIDGLRLALDRDDATGREVTAMGVASTFLTAGLTESVDLQVGADLFLRHKVVFRGGSEARSGLGDVYFRTKWTFLRDRGQGIAAAVMPYVKIPSNSAGLGNDSIEGGVMLPWEMDAGAGFTAGAMLRWDVARNDADNGYDSRWHLTGLVRRHLTRALAVYAEGAISLSSAGLSLWEGSAGGGVLLWVTPRIQLDYEMMRGLNRRASDWLHVLRVNWDW